MSVILFSAVLFALFFLLIYYSYFKPALADKLKTGKKSGMGGICFLILCAFVFRLVLAASITGYSTDLSCFKSWSTLAYQGGLPNFYFSDAFTDYPPGYMYVLWLLGAIQSWFQIGYDSTLFTVLIKLPAIICDLITGYFLYRLIRDRGGNVLAMCAAVFYLFNPAILVNSAAWGQVDSIYTLFVLLSIYYVCEKRLLPACIFFTIGFLIKPQAVIFTPILLLYLYQAFVKTDRAGRRKTARELALSAGICLAIVFVTLVPFAKNFNFWPIIDQYIKTLASYPYASVNAFNLFALFGGNWKDVTQPFLLLPYSVWSNIFIVAIVVYAAWVYIKNGCKTNPFLLGAFIITAMFVLAAKMHERYAYPALALLLAAFAYRRDKRYLTVFMLLSATQFFNVALMLDQDMTYQTTAAPAGAWVPLIAIVNLVTLIYLSWLVFYDGTQRAQEPKKAELKTVSERLGFTHAAFHLQKTRQIHLSRFDYIVMLVVCVVYTVVALFNLGDMQAPETYWKSENSGEGILAEFDGQTIVGSVNWFTGVYEEHNVELDVTKLVDGEEQTTSSTISLGSVFAWHKQEIGEQVSAIEIRNQGGSLMLNELVFTDENGAVITPVRLSAVNGSVGIENLVDEQQMLPDAFSYKNSTYFDEIYHARTAYEYLHGLWPYENTHPPLGKLLISIGIMIFGMNPFGWRIVGTLFGTMMLAAIYLFARRMFKDRRVALTAILLFALDFMHFTQTRIATIDVYITFFIILMYYFMYRYYTMSFYDTPFIKTLIPLGLSGLCMGLGIASKWTGVYAAVGLAVIFFISLGRRYYEYRYVLHNKNATQQEKAAVAPFRKYTVYTLLSCVVFFIVIPAGIYLLSYLPYLNAPGMQGFASIMENQFSMFSYHSSLTETHPFSSAWYEWPVIARPIWYYSGDMSAEIRMSIAALGNPFIWWLGIVAAVYTLWRAVTKRDRNALFLLIGYLAQYLPWVGVTRVVFIYHYFTCVPFIILMLCYAIRDWLAACPGQSLSLRRNARWTGVCIYVLICALAFVSFYPVLSGFPVPGSYLDSLKWFGTWTF